MPIETEAKISHLEEKAQKEGALPPLLQFYLRLLRVQARVEQKLAPLLEPSLGSETINELMSRGFPLLEFNEIALDWSLLRDTFTEVTAIFAEHSELFGKLPKKLTDPGASHLLTMKLVKAWFEGTKLPPSELAEDTNENWLMTIIHATVKPFLTSHARILFSFIDQEHWRREYCPICGGSPDFAFLDRENGARWLLCARCDTEWLFQRLQCPYCGTQDQNALSYFTAEEGLYRLYVCEQCKRYLKAVDLRQAKAEVLPPLERLYTLDLDRQAQERGYRPYDKVTRANEGKDTVRPVAPK